MSGHQKRKSQRQVMSPRGFASAFPAISSSAGDLKYQALSSSATNIKKSDKWRLNTNNFKHDSALDTLSEADSDDDADQHKPGFIRRNIRGLFRHNSENDEPNDEPFVAKTQTKNLHHTNQMDFSEFNLTQVALSLQMTLTPKTRAAFDNVRNFKKVVLGSEIVDALCKAGYASTTAEAHLIGIILLRGGYLSHVSKVSHFKRIIQQEPRFKTDATFYRLNSPSTLDSSTGTILVLRPFILHVHVNGARNLATLSRSLFAAPATSAARPSTYLKVTLGDSESASNIKTRTCNPMWDIDWLFAARSSDVVQVCVYNKTSKLVGGNVLLGRVVIAIDQLLQDPLDQGQIEEPSAPSSESPRNSIASVAASAAAAAAGKAESSPRSGQSWWELASFRGGHGPDNKTNAKQRNKRQSTDRFDHCRWYSLRDMHGRLCEGQVLLSLSLLNRLAYDNPAGMGALELSPRPQHTVTGIKSIEVGAKIPDNRIGVNRLTGGRMKTTTTQLSSNANSQERWRSGLNIMRSTRRTNVAIVPVTQAPPSPRLRRQLSHSFSCKVSKLWVKTDSNDADSTELDKGFFENDREEIDDAVALDALNLQTQYKLKQWRGRSVESKLSKCLDVQRVLDCTDSSVKRTSGLVRAYYAMQAVQRMVPRSLKGTNKIRSPTSRTPSRPLRRRFITFALPEVAVDESQTEQPQRRKSKNKDVRETRHLMSADTQSDEGVDKCVANVNSLNRGSDMNAMVQVQEVQTILLNNETTLVVEAVQLFGLSSREVATVHFLLTDRAPPLYGCEVCVSTDSEIPNSSFYTELVQRAHQLVLQTRAASGRSSSPHTHRGRVAGAVATAAAAAKTAAFGALDSVKNVEEVALCTPRCKMLVVEQHACCSQEMRKALFESAVFLNTLRATGHVAPWVEDWKASRVGSTRRQDVAALLENAGRMEHKTSGNAEARHKLFLGFGTVAMLFLALGTAQDWIPLLLRGLYALMFGWWL